ncbi:hypothetical protein LDENG_00012870 [Lucifuga dentata]|nr:hypothetical protein LDENG_00012870 [Lucifuga dentata]
MCLVLLMVANLLVLTGQLWLCHCCLGGSMFSSVLTALVLCRWSASCFAGSCLAVLNAAVTLTHAQTSKSRIISSPEDKPFFFLTFLLDCCCLYVTVLYIKLHMVLILQMRCISGKL